MEPRFRFKPGPLQTHGRASYSDYTLEYRASEVPDSQEETPPNLAAMIDRILGIDRSDKSFLVIADTLTLEFVGRNKVLVSLDSYTNKDRWKLVEGEPPIVLDSGALTVIGISEDEDRWSLNVEPQYEANVGANWVRISLGDTSESKHYEVGTNLVVGVRDDMITDVVLTGVDFGATDNALV